MASCAVRSRVVAGGGKLEQDWSRLELHANQTSIKRGESQADRLQLQRAGNRSCDTYGDVETRISLAVVAVIHYRRAVEP
ncbi:hypothetical protein FHL15_002389 [Xylaria flabelliformis]|uniref:Uncharacterized protein n=1 Tax=Xylaria flabelliformis TaxID=2512241 RepID=A0A553I935_9PEZI|nr:hypothetical protein FHL15_002389 [Xylaria flabelliformis]